MLDLKFAEILSYELDVRILQRFVKFIYYISKVLESYINFQIHDYLAT